MTALFVRPAKAAGAPVDVVTVLNAGAAGWKTCHGSTKEPGPVVQAKYLAGRVD